MPLFEARTEVPVSAADAFRWHARPGAFLRLTPPSARLEVVESRGGIEDGARLSMRLGSPPFSVRWVAVHRGYQEGRRFVDVQETGPFARWIHEHSFEDRAAGRSIVVDRIDYELPFGSFGARVGEPFARRRLERLFRYRGTVTAGDLARHAPYAGQGPLRIGITGASGMLGTQLAAFLTAGGHEVLRFARGRTARPGEIAWNPATGRIDHEALEGLDAIINLAGASIAGGRWTEARKEEILSSRVAGTRLVATALAVLRDPPKALLSASAVGFYGPCREDPVDEGASGGPGFLAHVVRAWEEATEPACAAGIRTVTMRFGVILTRRGGALARMLPAFKIGLGGPIGSGRQGFSWIGLDDAIYAIHHALRREDVSGPVNVVSPNALPQREFARALGRALRRPAIAPLPARVVRALFGQLGEEALLGGQFVKPAVLQSSGFAWDIARLEDALIR